MASPTDRLTLRLRARWSRLSRADRLFIAFLVALPVLIEVPFSLLGHPLLPGDDLTQNYPLRVLSGEVLRSGHLPTWDSYIWSGTPLLAGWNAGSLYPGTWLFAFLPGVPAWTINLVSVSVVCGTGTYALLRRLGASSIAALLAALAFTYTGFMSGQIVHIGLSLGTSYLPWILFGIDELARRDRREVRVEWIVLLGVAGGLTVLSGDPRAATTSVIAALIFVIAQLIRRQRQPLAFVRDVALAALLGAGASGIQWVPGIAFLHASQRGVSSYTFFGTGSLSLLGTARQMLLPFLLGSNRTFGLPSYLGAYNLPELTIGVGLMAIVALVFYAPDVLRSIKARMTRVGTRYRPDDRIRRDLGVWYVITVVGVLLMTGNETPLGHLLIHVPLYGSERLQNRNAAMVDLALVVLMAFFVDDVRSYARRRQNPTVPVKPLISHVRRGLIILPLAVSVAVIAFGYIAPIRLEERLHIRRQFLSSNFFREMSPYLITAIVLAVLFGAFVLFHNKVSPRALSIAVVVLSLMDTSLYLVGADYASVPDSVLSSAGASSQAITKLIGPDGRFAIFNPFVRNIYGEPHFLTDLGIPDINILKKTPSVQGYGSIVQGAYQNETGTHGFEGLLQGNLPGSTFDTLDLRALASLPIYFDEAIPITSAVPVAGAPPVAEIGQIGPLSPAPGKPPFASGPWNINPSQKATWILSQPETVKWVTVFLNATAAPAPKTIEVGVSGPTNSTPVLFSVPVIHGQAHYYLAKPTSANAVVVENTSSEQVLVGAVIAATQDPDLRLLLDGALQGDLSQPHWTYTGKIGDLSVFQNSQTHGLAWLEQANADVPDLYDSALGEVTTTRTSPSDPEVMLVRAKKAVTLVRSETYAPGWVARVTPLNGGKARELDVKSIGLVQQVQLPAGSYQVTWQYAPIQLLVGLVLSIGAFVVAVGSLILSALVRRRRQHLARS